MEQRLLIDTNLIIYAFSAEPTPSVGEWLAQAMRESFKVSVITKIEFLGWREHTEEGYAKAVELLQSAQVYGLEESVVEKTVELRRKHRIRLPDAVIAATCLVYDLTLATRNTEDFTAIQELQLHNPFNPEGANA